MFYWLHTPHKFAPVMKIKIQKMKKLLRGTLMMTAVLWSATAIGQMRTLNVQISSSSDDAEERGANAASDPGLIDLVSSDIELVNDWSDGDQYIGLRFPRVEIPQGTEIESAYIQFSVDEDVNRAGEVYIQVEDTDNGISFGTNNFNISSRSVLMDTITWSNIPSWTVVGESGVNQRTPDLKSLITKIVNRAGWISGNAINFRLTGTGSRIAEAYDGTSSLAPTLVVKFKASPLANATFPLENGSDWNYNDKGLSLDGTDWTKASYSVDSWDQGAGPLGYGNSVSTDISYGADANNKIITYYFRRNITVDLNTMPDSIEMGLLRDDGAVVYINGKEVRRDNLPSGAINYKTISETIVSGADESKYYTTNIYKSDFVNGVNTIAVEVHNRDSISSDISFDMYLKKAPIINPKAMGCQGGNDAHIACFTSIAPTAQTRNLIYPGGSHRFQLLFAQGTPYSIGGGTVPGNHDFTAYVGLEGSSRKGHVAINHENGTGAVSIIDVHYDSASKLWEVDSSQAVDFSAVQGTGRNCSGGITPWGTVITAEETSSGDSDGDGYDDKGWLVEIDPITAKVLEYGNGKQEKLWACGKISHENALILTDNKTLFTGEDGGSSAVFKFVADKEKDLSKGKLYALKLDDAISGYEPTGTTGTWIEIPNTTQADRNNTRSLAQSLGATNFNGVEDIEVNPITGEIYFCAKGASRTYAFTDGDSTVSNFRTFVGGKSYNLNTESGIYTEPWGSGNDNLTFDDKGNLWVLQDGGRNYIWVIRPDHTQEEPKVELYASFPIGSEPTGLTFTPDYKYGFVSVQHPSSANTAQEDASFNQVTLNKSATIVIARSENLGISAPVAGFTADNTTITLGETVTFTDTSSNDPTDRKWFFNGAANALGNNKVETVFYNAVGTYSVELVVGNVRGEDKVVKKEYITVVEPTPVSAFLADNIRVNVGESVNYSDLSTNNPTTWEWSFEGGVPASSTLENPTVKYENEGKFAVTLKTTNATGDGTVESKTEYIEVVNYLSTDELTAKNGLKVYPNPTTGNIQVAMNLTGGENVSIEVFDLMGKKLGTLLTEDTASGSMVNWNFDLSQVSGNANTVMVRINVNGKIANRIIQIVQ